MSMLDTLKRLDAYPKISLDDRDFRNKTIGGATSINNTYFCMYFFCKYTYFSVTILSTIVIIFLVSSEVFHYLTPKVSEDLFVDTTRSHKLKINLDLYIPTISCACKLIFMEIIKM